ncbi:hypothetical protein L1887_48251 [Cichorium endivia]|nr:hypothetical protein L1887_48251 [Cichorium endivia]
MWECRRCLALEAVGPLGGVLGDPSVLEALLVAPVLGGLGFGLPGPHEPTDAGLVRVDLGLPHGAEEALVVVGEGGGVAGLRAARVDLALAASEGAVVPGTAATAVETLGTVGEGGGPLSEQLVVHLVGGGDLGLERAVVAGAVLAREAQRVVVKDGVDVRVDRDGLVLGREQLVVPVVGPGGRHEFVADDDEQRRFGGVAAVGVAHHLVAALVEVEHDILVGDGLVEQLNGSHRVGVLGLGELARHGLEHVERALHVGGVAGPGVDTSPASVVEAVLVARRSVQVDEHLEVVLASPDCGLLEQVPLVELEERLARAHLKGPVTDGDADVVETGGGHLPEVVLADKRVEVVLQDGDGLVARLKRAKGPLVDDLGVARLTVDAGRDEVFDDEPTAERDTAHLAVAVLVGEAKSGQRTLVERVGGVLDVVDGAAVALHELGDGRCGEHVGDLVHDLGGDELGRNIRGTARVGGGDGDLDLLVAGIAAFVGDGTCHSRACQQRAGEERRKLHLYRAEAKGACRRTTIGEGTGTGEGEATSGGERMMGETEGGVSQAGKEHTGGGAAFLEECGVYAGQLSRPSTAWHELVLALSGYVQERVNGSEARVDWDAYSSRCVWCTWSAGADWRQSVVRAAE